MGDQTLSSLTNFALGILVARSVSASAFGAFALVFATYSLTVGAARAYCSEPLAVRYSVGNQDAWLHGVRIATGAALGIGMAVGLGLVAASVVASAVLRQVLIIVGLGMAGLIVQDTWRAAFFVAQRGRDAFVLDFVWAVAQFSLLGLLVAAGVRSVVAYSAVWVVAGNVSFLAAVLRTGVWPDARTSVPWFRLHRELALRYLGEFAAGTGATSGVIYATAYLAGLAAAGAFRAGQLLMGPFSILNMGMTLVMIPAAAQRLAHSVTGLRIMMLRLAATLSLAALSWGLAVYAVPNQVGVAILHRSWEGGHALVVPLAVAAAAEGATQAAFIGLRALAAARRSLRARLICGALEFIAGAAGAAAGGAVGAASGLAAGSIVAVIVSWRALGAGTKEFCTPAARTPPTGYQRQD